MRIKRLDITGFKSFMDRSVFTFDDGITGVVGPNGCGKSNVVDAIRWAMGEQSAKNLRGRGMEDVIFNGSETQAPLNMAEVSLTFRIEEQDVLSEPYSGFPEITITRRLFRSGESEYLINKTVCRLLDITEVFLGTGVGTKAYSIIEQGRVGLIVSSKPEDRRSLIEEAAGVTKYKSRRRAAERKMEYTEQNLLRVTDVVSELEKRLDQLSRQAKKAEKYRRLKSEVRELELHHASHRFLSLSKEQGDLLMRLSGLSSAEQDYLDQVRTLEATIDGRRSALEVETADLQGLQERVHALESGLQRDEQNLAYWEQDALKTNEQGTRARDELALLSTQQQDLVNRGEQLEHELHEISGTWRQDEVDGARVQDELKMMTLRQNELSISLDLERVQLVTLAAKAANHESNLASLGRQKTDLTSRKERAHAEAESLRADEARLDRARSEVAKLVNQCRQLTLELAERKGIEEAALIRTRQAFTENEVGVMALREELADKKSRLHSLEEIQRGYEGFDRGVRAVMLDAGEQARAQGIFGLVADVLSTSARLEKAFEAALGERLQTILVETRDQGLGLMNFLKGHAEGRSSFLPLESLPATCEQFNVDRSAPGFVAAAWEEVHCEDALLPVVRALLQGVLVFEDLEAAQTFQRHAAAGLSGGPAWTVVTLEGDVLRADGSMTGGLLEGPAVGALQKKREVAELGEEVLRLTERYQEVLTRHHQLQKQMVQTEDILKSLARNHHTEEMNLASQEKDLHRAAEDLTRLRERLGGIEAEDQHLAQALVTLELEEEANRGEVAHARADRAGREDRVRNLAEELTTLRGAADQKAAELTSLRIKVAAHTERGDATRRELERLLTQRRELSGRIGKLDASLSEGTGKLAELARRIEEARSSSEEARGQRDILGADLETRRGGHQTALGQVREQEAVLKDLRQRLDEVTQGVAQVSLRERELVLELMHLGEGVRERHQVELAEQLPAYRERALEEGGEEQVKELRGQLERMGEINLTAIDEHSEIEMRFNFLAGQKNDLESSLRQLREAIHKIDQTSRERFNQTFHAVNDKFQKVFPRLFGGGRAALVLTEEGTTGEQGVEIIAQPPGKKLQSVTLLSGGEKALTAVGLIFSIFLLKPTPFCLLDEVDAPLDEGNVGRYNDMVREMSKTSQFILITHNKRTMEISDTMYGVTMEEPGISKLVAVKLREALAHNGDLEVA